MSTTTDKLALFKYDPSTDGAQTFNIQKALNDNWDKLDDAVKEILITLANKAAATHADRHAKGGADPITPESIGAAPGGFGLGGRAKWLTDADDVNTISESGWYAWDSPHTPKNAINLAWSNIMRVDAQNAAVNAKTIYGVAENLIGAAIVARNMTYGSHISDWEYENPPMTFGVEYRTTERHLGKPVYVRLVDLGEGTNGKTINVGTVDIIHVECRATFTSYSLPMPELPFGSTDKSIGHTNAQAFYTNANTVTIIKGSTCPAFTATAKVYYIKSTD